MKNASMELDLQRLRLARDLILCVHVSLRDQGIASWSVIGHLEGALEDVLDSMRDIRCKCETGQCSPEFEPTVAAE